MILCLCFVYAAGAGWHLAKFEDGLRKSGPSWLNEPLAIIASLLWPIYPPMFFILKLARRWAC